MIKETNKRIMITCDEFMLEKFDFICETFYLSYSQLFSIFAEYLEFIDSDNIDFNTYLKIRFSAAAKKNK